MKKVDRADARAHLLSGNGVGAGPAPSTAGRRGDGESEMRLVFEDNLEHQRLAIESVADLFIGQGTGWAEFGGTPRGCGNRPVLSAETVLQNLREVQARNGIPPSSELAGRNFMVRMETGTGKTYVCLSTMFELHRRWGYAKFIIVVPSVAIRERTRKALEVTRDHFGTLYPEARSYEYFLFDFARLGDVRAFAEDGGVQIMLVTVAAINRMGVSNTHKPSEMTGGDRSIDLVRGAGPIIIVDDPQSVDDGLLESGRRALDDMGAACTLGYSATPASAHHHMVYRLSADDAYWRGLVKQIEVASVSVTVGGKRPYVRLRETRGSKGHVTAIIEFGTMGSGRCVSVEDGDPLDRKTRLGVYRNHRVRAITAGKNPSMALETPGGTIVLRPGEETHGVDPDTLNRLMIQRTIKAHLDKEDAFLAGGRQIKVLSLFFVDKVRHYRDLDAEGNVAKGKLASMFEEEYARMASGGEYRRLFEDGRLSADPQSVHVGYFFIDKKGGWYEPERKATGKLADNATNREGAGRAHNLIMRDREKLLGFGAKPRFIFSHSALREGWDNPNIFQICALWDMGSLQERRQTVGCGLRLCVDQAGARVRDAGVNVLTVVAIESYKWFAENLQREIDRDSGMGTGIVR